MSRKTMSFSQLITYIAREGRTEGSPILQNLSTDGHDLDKVNRAFMQNAKQCPSRKNGIFLYHEILSLSPEDKPHATPEILTDLAERYLSRRAPGAMAWGRVHFDKNPHIHLVISANLRGQKKKLRLSRKAFASVKRELEAYQKQHYPELSSSIVFDDTKKKAREVKEKTVPGSVAGKLPEQERKKRLIKQGRAVMSQKEILRRNVLEAFTGSVSLETFTARLQQRDITLYQRNGRLAGVVFNNKKHRFKTLGLEETLQAAKNRWEKIPNRHKALRNILAEKARVLFREFGVADRIKAVLKVQESKQRAGQHPRLDAIRQILDKKRQLRGPPDRGREGV